MYTTSAERVQPFVSVLRPKLSAIVDTLILGALILWSTLFLVRVPLQQSTSFSPGTVASFMLRGFHPAETAHDGRGFRWTDGDGSLPLPPQGIGSHFLHLDVVGPPPPSSPVPSVITINQWAVPVVALGSEQRRYSFLVPGEHLRLTESTIRIQSETWVSRPGIDDRTLGVAVFDVGWQRLSAPSWLVPLQMLVIAIAASSFYMLLAGAGVQLLPRLVAVILFLGITLAMRHSDTRFIYRWQAIFVTLGLDVLLLGCLLVLRWRGCAAESLASLRSWVSVHWTAFAGYVVVTVAMLFPLVARLTTHIIGFPGDAYEYVWKMQWFSDALTNHYVSPAFAPHIFFPNGLELARSEMTPGHTLLGLPITWLFGSIVSYNLVLLLSYLLTAFFTYLLAHRLGAKRGAAWVAGIIFAFCLRRFFQQNGHLTIMGTQWLALALYGWEGVLTRRRRWDGFVAGVGLGMAAWASWYFGPTFALLLALYTPLRLGVRNLPGLIQVWQAILVAGAVTITLILPIAQPYIETSRQDPSYKHPLIELEVHSSEPREYLLTNRQHPLWGTWAARFYSDDGGDHFVALGYSVLALGLWGIWSARNDRRVVGALVAMILVNVIVTFGPYLWLRPDYAVTLPVKFIHDHVPVLNGIRVWNRTSLYVVLCMAVLAALGLTRLSPRRYQLGWILAACLVLFEYASLIRLDAPGPRAVDLWLHEQPGSGAVIQFPSTVGGIHQFYSLFNEKPTNAWSGTFMPARYQEAAPILAGFPDDEALRLLQRWQTDYIVIYEPAMALEIPGWQTALAAQPLVTLEYRGEGHSVYHLKR